MVEPLLTQLMKLIWISGLAALIGVTGILIAKKLNEHTAHKDKNENDFILRNDR